MDLFEVDLALSIKYLMRHSIHYKCIRQLSNDRNNCWTIPPLSICFTGVSPINPILIRIFIFIEMFPINWKHFNWIPFWKWTMANVGRMIYIRNMSQLNYSIFIRCHCQGILPLVTHCRSEAFVVYLKWGIRIWFNVCACAFCAMSKDLPDSILSTYLPPFFSDKFTRSRKKTRRRVEGKSERERNV